MALPLCDRFPNTSGTPALLKRLDAMVIDAVGRVYLGKDPYTDAVTFRMMYPIVSDGVGQRPNTIHRVSSLRILVAESGLLKGSQDSFPPERKPKRVAILPFRARRCFLNGPSKRLAIVDAPVYLFKAQGLVRLL